MTERKTCGTCGKNGGICPLGTDDGEIILCGILEQGVSKKNPVCTTFEIYAAYRQQRERADDAEHRLREALARLALRETLIDTLMHSGEVMAKRNMQLEVALLRDEGSA